MHDKDEKRQVEQQPAEAAEHGQQEQDAQEPSEQILSRRSLIKAGGAAGAAGLACSLLTGTAAADNGPGEQGGPYTTDFQAVKDTGATRESFWKEGGKYCVQKNVDVTKVDKGIIRARVDGEWHTFAIRELDDTFLNFNMGMRQRMMNYMAGQGKLGIYNDAHNAAIATYGGNRGDSRFTLNVAFKGMGWIPKKDKIDARIKKYQDNYTAGIMDKMKILYAGYSDKTIWDRTIQGSLELYTRQSNETHTFLNQMINPVSTCCFIGDTVDTSTMPPKTRNVSYELRTVARIIHHKDPNLTEHEKKIVKYINYAHDFFHGGPDKTKLTVHNIGVIYYVVEEFDNSPFGMTNTAGGMKLVPKP